LATLALIGCGASAISVYPIDDAHSTVTIVLNEGVCITRVRSKISAHRPQTAICGPTDATVPPGAYQLTLEFRAKQDSEDQVPVPVYELDFIARSGVRYRLSPADWQPEPLYYEGDGRVDPDFGIGSTIELPTTIVLTASPALPPLRSRALSAGALAP
jgi:hypothetical protein